MKKTVKCLLIIFLSLSSDGLYSQTVSTSNFFIAQPISDHTLYYSVSDTGTSKPIIWGLDLAWLSEANIRRGIAYMGLDKIDVVRASFTPTDSLINNDLQSSELTTLNQRLALIDLLDSHTSVMLNDDCPTISSWYSGNAAHWAALMDVTTRRIQEHGRKVISIAPFNEPDYAATGQGTINDFYKICIELKNNPRFDTIRICGGNTLNTDYASYWYKTLRSKLDEGNTHQLSGTFDNYATFYETVCADGKHATNDELHNVMEAMVGVEYGMQTGIWWGTAEHTRAEFVKASYGTRLAYGEDRDNWTAASVYRNTDGAVQAFVGESERQALTTTYRFVSKDKDVFYDGQGPQREFTVVMPGGSGYQVDQPNGEKLVNITWGDDIQPVIKGRYAIINKNSGKALEVLSGLTTDGVNIIQRTYSKKNYQQWDVYPVDSTTSGDFSYFLFTVSHTGKAMDVNNFSLDDGGNVQQWTSNGNTNQQWYLEYAGDGWFYIRNRYSAKCLEVANASTVNAANVQQSEKDGGSNQLWRFVPLNSSVKFTVPQAPSSLTAIAQSSSVKLNWVASPDTVVTGYYIYRSDTAGGRYNLIARNVTTTSYVDNTVTDLQTHYYVVKGIDNTLNRSAYSNEASAAATGDSSLVAYLEFENSLVDSTINLNHAVSGGVSYATGKIGQAVYLDGSSFLQLPAYLVNQKELTISTWINTQSSSVALHVFDFGNDESEYMYLTPNIGNKMCFVIKYNGLEQQLSTATPATGEWTHVAITINNNGTKMYVNGSLVAESASMTISPSDFRPILNYIGRSQLSTSLYNGYVDDFKVYNYALSTSEIANMYGDTSGVNELIGNDKFNVWPVPADGILNVSFEDSGSQNLISIYDINGRVLKNVNVSSNQCQLNISNLLSGIYILQLKTENGIAQKRFIVSH